MLEDILVDIARTLQQETGLPDLCFGGGVALNGVANARILPSRASSASSCRRRPATRAARSARPCMPTGSTSAIPIATCPTIRSGGRRVDAGRPGARRARGRSAGRGAGRAGARSSASPTTSPPAASSAGWTGVRVRSARARPSQHPRRAAFASRCAIASTATSSIAKSSGPSRRSSPLEVADRYFDLPPGGARLGALHVRRVPGPTGMARRGSPRSRTSTARRGCRRSSARWRRVCTRCSRRTGAAAGIPVLLNTSFNVAGEPIVTRALEGYSTFRRCGIDVLVAGSDRRDANAPRRRPPR